MTALRNIELLESLATALEMLAFVSISPVEGEIEPPTDAALVSIEFTGPRRGRVQLACSRELGRMLLDNTLACDPSDTLVMPNPADSLIELVNRMPSPARIQKPRRGASWRGSFA